MSDTTSVLLLTKYGRLGASSRLRTLQYISMLAESGLRIHDQPLMSDSRLQARYDRGNYAIGPLLHAYQRRIRTMLSRKQFDLLWIEKEALPWWPLWVELKLLRGVPFVLDFDDAIFHNYDQHRVRWVRQVFGRRLDGLMSQSALVVCGNQYLAQRARNAGAPHVEIVPTAIDLRRYPASRLQGGLAADRPGKRPIRIVWIGSPSTARYLTLLQAPLQELARGTDFVFRVIGGGKVQIPGVQVESLSWSEATEVEQIRACDVGVMPLLDSPWEQGKCGYKLIQYMACHLPVVASDVGVNPEIVDSEVNGFLARTPEEWVAALRRLLHNDALRAQMGDAGRRLVEQSYCIQQTGPVLASHLQSIVLPRK